MGFDPPGVRFPLNAVIFPYLSYLVISSTSKVRASYPIYKNKNLPIPIGKQSKTKTKIKIKKLVKHFITRVRFINGSIINVTHSFLTLKISYFSNRILVSSLLNSHPFFFLYHHLAW